jgi:mitofusin
MSYNEFINLKPREDLNDSDGNSEGEDTVIPGFDDVKNIPTSVMYHPGESGFSNDSNTLVDGQVGGSRQTEGSSNNFESFGSSKNQRAQTLNASFQQLHYNESRISLNRSINQTIELLKELTAENTQRPVFYPTDIEDAENKLLNSRKAHLALVRNASTKLLAKAKIEEEDEAPDFKVLKLNVKIGHNNQNNDNFAANLDKQSLATLFQKKLDQQVKYLLNLKDRVDDTTSKVFVTGDLNAGKSTFCNALLRRKILPEDQQPCTSVFCEVIDASKENNSVEEVHAVPIGNDYNIRDESSFEVHSLKELEDLVYDCDRFSLLKVYVLDHRSFQESLLHNGVIDIKLIDAPGLNMDSYQTTQVFSRQEEIDLVVFVVNSENHFTLSAKEFIAAAAAEKRYVFIVVNRFDNIRDKEKCKAKILDQVKNLSPDTYKNASDFVHFVSSTDVLEGKGDGGDDGGDGPDDNEHPDFDQLEASLRKFILEKRAISKLLPAKSYLLNLLNDLETLSVINEKIYAQEKEDKVHELRNQVAPKYNEIMTKSLKIGDTINNVIDVACTEVYNDTKKDILNTVNQLGEKQIVPYQGLQYLYEYAKATQSAMIETVLEAVHFSETRARDLTAEKVQEITTFGQQTLGEEFLNDKVFQADLMFTRKQDGIKRKLDDLIEIADFFDPSWESFFLWLGVPKEFVSTTRQQLNYYNPAAFITSIPSNAVALKSQLPTQLTLQTIYSSGKIITAGAAARKIYSVSTMVTPTVLRKVAAPIVIGISGFTIYYLINDIPNAFPRKQARKIKKQIYDLDYPHMNATRVSKECLRVLNYPSRQVMNNFQTSIDKRSSEKEKLEQSIKDADLSYGYFHSLLSKIQSQKGLVGSIDLESIHTVD